MHGSPAQAPTNDFVRKKFDPYVLVLAAAVCITVILLSYLRNLKRLCCRLSGARLSADRVQRRRHLNDPIFQDISLQFHSHGLESAIMDSLPTSQYRQNDEQGLKPSNKECAVCLGEFEEGEWLKHLPNCTHVFHIACIDTWFQTHSSCPLCRSHVYDFSSYVECSIPMHTLLESLRREHFYQERAENSPALRNSIPR
ncbi:hypothetical protein Tsubulata_023799 [Turnera subulata]|uniref:RING-type E3 ubiquitin transferase n=1 Tax=Turnera subulata TaxID=218843 RepID=A0A9Q0G324_9ROSI|nr:hypothetical protein Tsubulata_023799 [Turnera subulata]